MCACVWCVLSFWQGWGGGSSPTANAFLEFFAVCVVEILKFMQSLSLFFFFRIEHFVVNLNFDVGTTL